MIAISPLSEDSGSNIWKHNSSCLKAIALKEVVAASLQYRAGSKFSVVTVRFLGPSIHMIEAIKCLEMY